jgi:hypothetical protein
MKYIFIVFKSEMELKRFFYQWRRYFLKKNHRCGTTLSVHILRLRGWNGTGDVEDQGKEIKEHTVGMYLRKEKNDSFPPFIFKRFNPLKWRVEKRKIRIGQVSSHVFPFLHLLSVHHFNTNMEELLYKKSDTPQNNLVWLVFKRYLRLGLLSQL